MLERRSQGLCFNCDDPYVWSHQCQCLFFLEHADFLVNDPADDVATEVALGEEQPLALIVSLYAFAGFRTEETMNLHVYIHGHKLLALLDSGSTHIFINAGVMCHLGLVTGDNNMWVTVANGDHVARNVAMCIGKEDFSISCFRIDLGSFDLVLGVDYLCTLGPSYGISRASACPSVKATSASSGRALACRAMTSTSRPSLPWPVTTSVPC